jgi:hypothetical protein
LWTAKEIAEGERRLAMAVELRLLNDFAYKSKHVSNANVIAKKMQVLKFLWQSDGGRVGSVGVESSYSEDQHILDL